MCQFAVSTLYADIMAQTRQLHGTGDSRHIVVTTVTLRYYSQSKDGAMHTALLQRWEWQP